MSPLVCGNYDQGDNMKILTIVGARPQFVKAAVVSRAIQNTTGLAEVIAHTGQHFDANMSSIFFDELSIPHPKHNLGIGGGSHAENTGRMLKGIEDLIHVEKPNVVLVYGDTDSTLAGALAAAKLCVPVAHIEAGLRSFNRNMPEEINRILTDHISSLLFPPTEAAVKQLESEGISGEKVENVGDVMFDAIKLFNPVAEAKSTILETLCLDKMGFALCTLHRKENTDDKARLRSIIDGLGRTGIRIILPLHPRTNKMLTQFNISLPANITVIEPVGYLDMITLMRYSCVVGTDSGGVQKEAYFQGVSCVTFRNETEWVELVDLGVNVLVGADTLMISEAMTTSSSGFQIAEIYGRGNAAELISARLASEFLGA